MLHCKQQRLETKKHRIIQNIIRANARQHVERLERTRTASPAARWAARQEIAWQREVKRTLHSQLEKVEKELREA